MKTVILCGGKGTRYDIERPKSLAIIGDKPIIHHVMDIYSIQGFNDFILAIGWKGDHIENYFKSSEKSEKLEFDITFVDTGIDSNTGHRIKLIEDYIGKDKDFFCTYSDGLANIDLSRLIEYHKTHKKIATITAVRPYHQFGILRFDNDNIISFDEKPRMNEYINGGFFIFNRQIFDYIYKDNNDELEKDIFPRLLDIYNLVAYKHEGFWDTLNTPKDEIRLNRLYDEYVKTDNILEWHDII